MAWESRNGRGRYYTRSRRERGQVVREYVGCGIPAEQAARADALGRELARHERAAWRAIQHDHDATAALVAEADALAEDLARAALLSAGYHRHHRGEWRKRRGDG